jgi:hypothetical protein
MANLYDERVLGTRQKIALAQKLRESGQASLQGQMIGDRYVPASWTQGLAQGLKQGLGTYQEMKGEQELKDIQKERSQGDIQTLGAMGIPATSAMLSQAGTPAESAPMWKRAAGALGIIDEPKGTPAQPYKQTLIQNPTEEAKRNALIQYQMNNGGDLGKLLGAQHNLRPEFTIGPNGEKLVTLMNDPTHAVAMTLSTDNAKPVISALYSPTEIGLRTKGKQQFTPTRVPTKQGVTIMSGVEALRGDTSLPPTDENGGILHYDSENDSSAYIYPDGSYREVQ